MNLIKKTCGFLILLSLLLTINATITYASSACPSTGKSRDATVRSTMNVPTGSYVVTELNEPISAIDEIIKNGEVTVSQVFLKYKCTATADQAQVWDPGSTDGEGSAATQTTKPGTAGEIWFYEPAEGASCPSGSTCTYVQLLIGFSGTGLLKTYIAIIYRWAASIVGIISILVIVVSGIQISMDQGSGESVGEAKNRIMQSLAGLVILFLSALILYTINPTFFTA